MMGDIKIYLVLDLYFQYMAQLFLYGIDYYKFTLLNAVNLALASLESDVGGQRSLLNKEKPAGSGEATGPVRCLDM